MLLYSKLAAFLPYIANRQWAIVAYMGVAGGVDTKMISNHYKTPVNEIRIIKSIIHLDKQ